MISDIITSHLPPRTGCTCEAVCRLPERCERGVPLHDTREQHLLAQRCDSAFENWALSNPRAARAAWHAGAKWMEKEIHARMVVPPMDAQAAWELAVREQLERIEWVMPAAALTLRQLLASDHAGPVK